MPLARSNSAIQTRLNTLLGMLPPVAAPATTQVATGCALHNQFITSKQQLQSRTPHFMRDNRSAVSVTLPGFYVNGAAGEKALGAATTYTASVEYPSGTFTQLTFGGSTTGTAPDGGMVTSDLVTLVTPIPKGALFWLQVYAQCSAGITLKFTGMNGANGAKLAYASSGLTDQTMSGSITNSAAPVQGGPNTAASGYAFFPCAITGFTSVQSFFLLGDSRTAGSNDAWVGVNADQGELARSIGPFAPYINGGVSGDTLAGWVASHTNRLALAQMCTGVVLQLGINDTTGGATLATMQGNFNTIRGYFGSAVPFFTTTMAPVATSASIAISSLTSSGRTCTATTAATAGLQVGQLVTVSGSTTANYNGTVQVTSIPSDTTFTYTAPGTPGATTAAGTVVFNDAFTTTGGQTTSGANANRVSFNAFRRGVPSGFKACFELADVMEFGRDDGRWTTQYGSASGDGTHPWNALYMAIQRSGAISAAMMV